MERDKKGRFVKKALTGTLLLPELIIKGKKYKLKLGMTGSRSEDWISNAMLNPDGFALPLLQFYEPASSSVDTGTDASTGNKLALDTSVLNRIKKPEGVYPTVKVPELNLKQNYLDLTERSNRVNSARFSNKYSSPILYQINDGKWVDEYGMLITPLEIMDNQKAYTRKFDVGSVDNSTTPTSKANTPSAGMTLFGTNSESDDSKVTGVIDKLKLSDFLQFARAGLGYVTNNKVAERAIEAEKPFLLDVVESYRPVYGDYRSKVEGHKAAARLSNLASKHLTSDGALLQQMMMDAAIKGLLYIDLGNAKDEALIRQTKEVALQQEKENAQLRQAAAMQNRKSMLTTNSNIANIKNARDSANYSQITAPLLSGMELRARNKEVITGKYEDYYRDHMVTSDVWSNFRDGLSESLKVMADKYITEGPSAIEDYIRGDKTKQQEFMLLLELMNNEIIRRQALSKGVYLNPPKYINTSNDFGIFTKTSIFSKKGGTLHKATLRKRTKDNDRGSKSIESSRKIAARFLEKAIDSLYTYNDIEIIAKPAKKSRKYLAGGGLPFVGFSPVFATSETDTSTETMDKKKSKTEDDDLTNKDILLLLKDMDGLPADMQLIVGLLLRFNLMNKMDPLGMSSSSDIASRYLSIINEIKVAKFNREEYNNAFNLLKGNGGLNEYAITSEGSLIGTNKEGDFLYFIPEEISKGLHSKEGYLLLTNSNLLYLRANSIDAAFNHNLITIALNGVGMNTVNALISEAIDKLGTTSSSEEGYTKTKRGELLSSLEDFYNAIQASEGNFDGTVNDLYKYKLLTKSQAEQIKKAIYYVYSTLPINVKSLLKVKSDGTENGALKLIESIISSKETNQIEFDLNLVGGKTHKSTTNSNKDISELETSLPLNVLKGIGGVDSYIDIDRGDGIHMSVKGTLFNLIKTPNGEPILDTSLSNMLNQSGLQSIVKDMRNIQFGDQKVTPEALSFITYNNTGITRANLPIKDDGSVNLDLLESYEKAEADIELSGDKSPENIKKIYEQYGITSLLNADGTYNQSKFAPFMVTEGYTTDALSGIKESDFVVEYRGNTDAAVALMQKSLAVGTGKNITTPDVDTFSWYNPSDWFGWTDTIFKGVLYIPITNNVNTAVFGANQSLDYDEALAQEEKYQNFERMSNQRSTDASLLNI